MDDYTAHREERRRRFFRNLPWLIPAVIVVGTGLFFGIGHLFVWLWRVTLVDIFAIKPISFWQAWGLILLSQFLFKAHVRPMTRTGSWRGRGWGRGDAPRGEAPGVAPGHETFGSGTT